MWGGRFAGGPAAIMEEINASVEFDKRLAEQDLAGSRAHAAMLAKQGIISADDAAAIATGLDQIAAEIKDGQFTFKRALEDIHLNIEARLAEIIGPAAGRLHTARSRNDQVATDFRLWVREACARADAGLARAAARAAGAGREACRHDHAGLHASAAGPARDLRPSLPGLCRDVRARPRPLRERRSAHERIARWVRPRWPARPSPSTARRRQRRWASRGRCAIRSMRSRRRDFALDYLAAASHRRRASVAAGRRDRDLGFALLRLRQAERRVLDRLLDHAAEEKPRRGRTRARQDRAHPRQLRGADDGDEGARARLCQGSAGRQGTGV